MSWDEIERRRFVRVKFPCRITIHTPHKQVISTHAENISAGGVRIIFEQKLEPSSTVKLELYGIKEEPIICTARVRWVFSRKITYRKNLYLFDTGMEFEKIKKEDITAIKNLVACIIANKPECEDK